MLAFDITAEEFRSRYFEKQPRLQKAALRSRPLDWADLDQVLSQVDAGEPTVKLLNQGPVPEHAYSQETVEMGQRRRRFNKVQFHGQMRSGATLIVNRFENFNGAARRLCAEVASFAGLQTMSNGYLSCGGRGTFGKHWDTHDVFAIQLLGRKRWQVFAPTFPLPLSNQTSDRAASESVTHPMLDCVLEPGDVLYVPRGWWHQALPLEEGSFHLSVGTYAATVYDYFMWACSRHLAGLQAARGAFSAAGNREDTLLELTRAMGSVVRDPALWEEFQRELVQRERLNSEFQLGLFLDPAGQGLRGNALLRLTSCYPLQGGVPAEMSVNGARLRLDSVDQAVVNALRMTALSFDALCAQLGHVHADAIQRAVLSLSQYEVVNIETAAATSRRD
jgi:ribosomal protein L16 Arg81 hydroxylase